MIHLQYLQSGPEVLQGSLGHLVYHGRVGLGSYLNRQGNLSFLMCSEPDRKGEVESRYFQVWLMEMKRNQSLEPIPLFDWQCDFGQVALNC